MITSVMPVKHNDDVKFFILVRSDDYDEETLKSHIERIESKFYDRKEMEYTPGDFKRELERHGYVCVYAYLAYEMFSV